MIFSARDPRVRAGQYDREGFTPAERKALERKRLESARHKRPGSKADRWGVWRCGRCGLVEPCGQLHIGRLK